MLDKKMNDEENDVVSESVHEDDVEIEELESRSEDKLKKLKAKLRQCEKEKASHLEEFQRAKADFLNSKKRLAEQLDKDTERVANNFIEKLLPLCDSFDMAMSDTKSWKKCDESWRSGIEAIYTQLDSILRSYDVEKIGEKGEMFDPNKHEAVSTAESDETQEIIIEVLQSGYKRGEHLIRPAKVILSK